MPLHDISYQHWEGAHRGLWGRRLVIAKAGVLACLQLRGMRQLVFMCWMGALLVATLLFLVGQLLVADSIVVQWAGNLNPQLQSIVRLLTTWLEQHPEVSVRTTQNILFHYFAIYLMPISIFVLGMAIPLFITRDLSSNAIIIYASKAINRGDYFFGKFATAFGLLSLTWLGPVCAAWFLGNLVAPDWRFFWHSRAALGHLLLFGLGSLSVLSLLALGVSSLSAKEKTTPVFWYLWWVLGGVIAPIAAQTRPWLRHASFKFNLDQLALAIFRPAEDIRIAQQNIPLLGDMLRNIPRETMKSLDSPAITGALISLALMLGLAAVMLNRKVKPE